MASIRKRGENSYLLVVSRGYDYQGNRLKPAQKTVHPPKGLTAKQTEKWLNEQAVLYEREVKRTPGEPMNRSITLAKYIDIWLEQVAPKKLAASTLVRDKQDIRRILPALGHYKLVELNKDILRAFYDAMRSEQNWKTGGLLAEKTVEGIHSCLCGILSDAVEAGYITHNPAWRAYRKKGAPQERPVADEETVQRLITAPEGQSLKYEVYFKLILATGMRRGEACGLRWSDIDWRQRALHIRRNVVKLSGQPILVKEPKTRAGGTGDRSVKRTRQTASCLAKRKCVGERTAWWRGTGGRGLSVPTARRGTDGAEYIHIPVQKDSAGGQFAGQFERAQPAAHQRQHAHCSGCGCTHCGGPVGARTAQHNAGYLQPCFRQEQKARTGEAGRGDGAVAKRKLSPIALIFLGLLGLKKSNIVFSRCHFGQFYSHALRQRFLRFFLFFVLQHLCRATQYFIQITF